MISSGICSSELGSSKQVDSSIVFSLEHPPGIEPGVKDLQSSAFPLGYGCLF
jgi:hypothetical protein